MGILDDLKASLAPHAEKLNQTIALQGALIHQRLMNIERAVTAPVVADRWQRFTVNQALAENETIEIGTVPLNEVWALEALVVDGVFVKAPAFVLESAHRLIASVIKEGVGTEKLGGDLVCLPGESLTLTARAAGQVALCLHIVRKPLTAVQRPAGQFVTKSADVDVSHNTHDPARDMVLQRTQGYIEPGPEVRDTGGSPPLVQH